MIKKYLPKNLSISELQVKNYSMLEPTNVKISIPTSLQCMAETTTTAIFNALTNKHKNV